MRRLVSDVNSFYGDDVVFPLALKLDGKQGCKFGMIYS
jgi:hypothetical protein